MVLTGNARLCHVRANLPQLTGFGPHLPFTVAAVILPMVKGLHK